MRIVIGAFMALFYSHALIVMMDRKRRKKQNDSSIVSLLFKKKLLERDVSFFAEVIDAKEFDDLDSKVIYLVSGMDCETCVEKGFDVAKDIQKDTESQRVFVIGTQVNTGQLQFRNEWDFYITNDDSDQCRKSLQHVLTPVMFLLDESDSIKSVWFPTLSPDDPQREIFRKQVFSSLDAEKER